MGKLETQISEEHKKFIRLQKMFFVGTAPLSGEGHVNISPKGLEHLQVINSNQVMYLDLVGSGNETSAHLLENKRITFMFCSFDKVPKILRFYGKGRVILPDSELWAKHIANFSDIMGTRQIIIADIFHVQSSCGYGVPMYNFVGDRDILFNWAEKKGTAGIELYKKEKNQFSIDHLPTHLESLNR